MTAQIIDGRAIAQTVKQRVSEEIHQLMEQGFPQPGLHVILIGDNPASATYVKHKQYACKEVGIRSECLRLPNETAAKQLTHIIDECNNDPTVHGILLQLPLPEHIDPDPLLERIHPDKDVDGFHPFNLGRLAQCRPRLRPCTSRGVMTLLENIHVDLVGKHAVVVGASNIVGRPMALELLLSKCTVTICHRFTKDLYEYVKTADILVAATGKPGVIQSQWIKSGAIVIDVGFSRLSNGMISGDLEFESALKRASWITPVPGGVGPMTVATLLQNTVMALKLQRSSSFASKK